MKEYASTQPGVFQRDTHVLTDYLEGKKASDNFKMPKELDFEDQWKKEIGPLSDQLHKDEVEMDKFAMGPAVEKEISSHWVKGKVPKAKVMGGFATTALKGPALENEDAPLGPLDKASLLEEGSPPAVPSVPVVDKRSEQQLFQDEPRIAEESQKFGQWTDKLLGHLDNLDTDKKDSLFQEMKEMKERDADIEKNLALMQKVQIDGSNPHRGHHHPAAHQHHRPQKHHFPMHHPDPLQNEHSGHAHKSQHTNEGKTTKVHHHHASSLAQASERDLPVDPVEAKLEALQAKMQAQTRAFEAAAKHDALVEEGAVGAGSNGGSSFLETSDRNSRCSCKPSSFSC